MYDMSATAPSRIRTLSGASSDMFVHELGSYDGLGRFTLRRPRIKVARKIVRRARAPIARRGRRAFVGLSNAQVYEFAGMGEMQGFGKKLRKAVSRVTRVVTKPAETLVKKAAKAVEKVTVRPIGKVLKAAEKATVRPIGRVAKSIEKVTARPIGTLVRGAEKVVDSAANLTEKLADDPGSLLKLGVDAAAAYAGDPRAIGKFAEDFANIGRKGGGGALPQDFDAPVPEGEAPETTSGGFALDQKTVMIGAGVAVGLAVLYFSTKRR